MIGLGADWVWNACYVGCHATPLPPSANWPAPGFTILLLLSNNAWGSPSFQGQVTASRSSSSLQSIITWKLAGIWSVDFPRDSWHMVSFAIIIVWEMLSFQASPFLVVMPGMMLLMRLVTMISFKVLLKLFISCALLSVITNSVPSGPTWPMGESGHYGVGPVTLNQPHQHVHPSFSGHSASIFPGFGLPGPSARFPGVSVHRQAALPGNPDARTPAGLLQIPIVYCHLSFYWGNDTDWPLVEVFGAPKVFTFLHTQISQLQTLSHHQIQ